MNTVPTPSESVYGTLVLSQEAKRVVIQVSGLRWEDDKCEWPPSNSLGGKSELDRVERAKLRLPPHCPGDAIRTQHEEFFE